MSPTPTGEIERTADRAYVRFERHLAFPILEVWPAITEPSVSLTGGHRGR